MVAKGKETEFRVLCQHLKMESPAGTIQAEGNIHLSVVGIQINCDRLMLSWKDDWVRMEGNVNLIASNANNQGVEMKGKELLLRLTTLSSLGERETDSGIRRTSFPPPRIQETQEPDLGNVPVRNSPPPVPKKLPSFYPPTSKIN